MAPIGEIAGWDVLAVDLTDLHSWLCNGLGGELVARAGVTVEPSGLFSSLVDASAVAAAAEDLIGRNNDEYSFWTPVAMVTVPARSVPADVESVPPSASSPATAG